MTMRARQFAFVLFVLIIQLVCFLFYDRLRNEKRSSEMKYWRKTKNAKESDEVIASLQRQIATLREKLDKLKKSCREPARTVYTKDFWGKKEPTKVVEKNFQKYNASDWISDRSVFNMFSRASALEVTSEKLPQRYFSYKNLGKNGEYEHLNRVVKKSMSIVKKYLNLRSDDKLILKTGLYRDDTNFGAEYNIQVMCKGNRSAYNVRLIRPLSSLILIHPPARLNLNKQINIIVPLQGRLDRFQEFLNNFKKVCISRNENVFLTVVYSRSEGLPAVTHMLNALKKEYRFEKFELVTREQSFNRGHALHDGVQNWKGEQDVLLFFCDIDIVFDSGFIERCRTLTESGRTVYYPIVFNFYNPKYVRKTTRKTWKISTRTGFWRYYGYGMTCQHRQDYLAVGGFNLNITGWGSEDVQLHRKYVKQPHIRIIRSPDSSLFHRYHTKVCDIRLPRKQYKSCMSTKLGVEASKAQYGRRVLELEENIKKLKYMKRNG